MEAESYVTGTKKNLNIDHSFVTLSAAEHCILFVYRYYLLRWHSERQQSRQPVSSPTGSVTMTDGRKRKAVVE